MHTRSGDKGGDANVGVWVRHLEAWQWVQSTLTADELQRLLPETRNLPVTRHELPNLGAVNFVIHGLLGAGATSTLRLDAQATRAPRDAAHGRHRGLVHLRGHRNDPDPDRRARHHRRQRLRLSTAATQDATSTHARGRKSGSPHLTYPWAAGIPSAVAPRLLPTFPASSRSANTWRRTGQRVHIGPAHLAANHLRPALVAAWTIQVDFAGYELPPRLFRTQRTPTAARVVWTDDERVVRDR